MARKKKKNNKYYYAFVAIVLIIVILVAILDYNFRFGIVNWDEIFVSETESEKESQKVNVAGQIGNLTVTFIDVGQGDAILINFPDGTNMLVDAGENGSEDELEEHLIVNGEKLVLD